VSELGPPLFLPSRKSGIALREILNRDFALSFEHMFSACGEHFEIPERQAKALLSRTRAGSRETPFMFSLHFKLVEAIQDGRLDDVQPLIRQILTLGPAEPGILLTSFIPEEFPWDCETIAGYFSAEQDSLFRYVAPRPDGLPSRRDQIRAALDLIRRAASGLAAELEEIVTTIILARDVSIEDGSDPDARFQGASALRAFGAVLQNCELDFSVVDCATSLIHEGAHSVLFALSPIEGVAVNADDERHSSPLREDERPLEGIIHATFVLARIVYGMEAMLDSGQLSAAEQHLAAETAQNHRKLFFEGLDTTRRHGRLTDQGEAALEAAEAYMAAFA